MSIYSLLLSHMSVGFGQIYYRHEVGIVEDFNFAKCIVYISIIISLVGWF